MISKHTLALTKEMTLEEALKAVAASETSSAPIIDEGRVIGHLAGRAEWSDRTAGTTSDDWKSVESELRLASRIQQQLLPREIPSIPGLSVYGTLVSATVVGGDYWSAKYYRSDRRVTLKLADVTGHGIAAALVVPAVKFVSGGFYRGAPSPEWVMERTNHVLVKETPVELLVTMVYAWYEVETRQLRVVNAGHSPAFLARRNGIEEITSTGPALGLLESSFDSATYQLEPGDVFFVCSDGITESRGADGMFGDERVMEIVAKHRHSEPEAIARAVMSACRKFGGRALDDRSLVVARVNSRRGEPTHTRENRTERKSARTAPRVPERADAEPQGKPGNPP